MATGMCPSCNKKGVLCDDLEPDEDLRQAAREHLVGGARAAAQPAAAVPRLPAAPSAEDPAKTEDPMTVTENNAVLNPESETKGQGVPPLPPVVNAAAAAGTVAAAGVGTGAPAGGGASAAQTANVVAQAAAIAQAQLAQQMVAQRVLQAAPAAPQGAVAPAPAIPAPQAPSLLKALRGEAQSVPAPNVQAAGTTPLSPQGGGIAAAAAAAAAALMPSPPKLPPASERLAALSEDARACLPGGAPELLVTAFLTPSGFPISEMEFNRLLALHRVTAKPNTAAQIEAN